VTTYTITLHDPRDDAGDELVERVAYTNLLRSELPHDLPTITVADAQLASDLQPARQRTYAFRLWDVDGDLVGNATTTVDAEQDDDPDVLVAGINVLPAHRRQGLGTRLLAELVTLAGSLGKTVIVGDTFDGIPSGPAFAATIGATRIDTDHRRLIETPWELPVEAAQRWLAARGGPPPGAS
jgi:GNAT superfamily N-acetyltransferase